MISSRAVLATIIALLCLLTASTASAATITVNGTADTTANDGTCTLREAIKAANDDAASGAAAGECAAGSGADTIGFSALFTGAVGTSTISVQPGTGLPLITQPVTIAGGNCGAPKPCVGIDANGQTALGMEAPNVTISGLAVTDASGSSSVAIFGPDAPGFAVRNTWLGIRLDETPEVNHTGILVAGDGAVIGGTSANDRNVIAKTTTAGIRIFGANDTRVQGNYFGTLSDGITTAGVGNVRAIEVVGSTTPPTGPPTGTLIGGPDTGTPQTCDGACNLMANESGADIHLAGFGGTDIPAGETRIEGNFLGLDKTGAASTGAGAVLVGKADDVTLGGDASRRNFIRSEVLAESGATNLEVAGNFFGLDPAGATRVGEGQIELGEPGNLIDGADVTGNRIAATTGALPAIALGATDSLVRGNVIGIGTGNQNVGGGNVGIFVSSGSGNQIGGTAPGEGNVIGNASTGILLSNDSTVVGNVIGTDAAEAQAHPLSGKGILVAGDGNVIGGSTASSENVINNITSGDAIEIAFDGNDFNSVLRNRGSASTGQEFLEVRGLFGPGNGAAGANSGIERPTIAAGATSSQVSGTGALPGATVRVYRTASTAGATGPRDVTAFAGQATADGSGNWTLNCPSAGCTVGLPGGGQVTANQTAVSGDSSEMADPQAYSDLAPETTITSGPDEGTTTNDATPEIGFAANEPEATFACSVDGGSFTACVSPATLGPLSDGEHTVEVRATDGTSNPDPTPASRTFVVDATPPSVSIDSGPAAGSRINSASPTFGFTTEAGASVECRIDAEPFGPCSGPGGTHTPAAPLTDGDHTFEVRATDAATNSATAKRAFSVDTTGPETTITKKPKAKLKTKKKKAKLSVSFSSEAGASFECAVDNAGFAPCSSPLTATLKSKGGKGKPHRISIRAIDALGNTEAEAASVEFRLVRKKKS